MHCDGPLKIQHFPTGGRLTHTSSRFSLMTCLTAAVSRSSAESEIVLHQAFHDGFNCIKVAPLKSRSNFPIKRYTDSTKSPYCLPLMSLKTKQVRRFSHCLLWTLSLGKRNRQSGWRGRSPLFGWPTHCFPNILE